MYKTSCYDKDVTANQRIGLSRSVSCRLWGTLS